MAADWARVVSECRVANDVVADGLAPWSRCSRNPISGDGTAVAIAIAMVFPAARLDATLIAPSALLQGAPVGVSLAVHDASRLAWRVTVPLPEQGRSRYFFEVELEVPANLVGEMDPWSLLQSFARLEDADASMQQSPEAFRRNVVALASKLARARDGFVRHCTLIHSSPRVEENQARALLLWLEAISTELRAARSGLIGAAAPSAERALADEFLSIQLWTVLTDAARSLLELRRTLQERGLPEAQLFDQIERALAQALKEEIAYRRTAQFPFADPVNTLQLERLLSRMRWLKKHFERVTFLDVESYQVAGRLAGWFSAGAAILAYLWFLMWQIVLEHRPAAIGSGVVVVAFVTVLAYASRERIKEAVRNWLAGRIQSMFAQRVTRYRMPEKGRQRGPIVVLARESFSQSTAQRGDPVHPGGEVTHDVTLLRLKHRGVIARPTGEAGHVNAQVRLGYRLDLSSLFPRLSDAVRGFASLDERTGGITIVDVPRNYELPVRANVRRGRAQERIEATLVLNKNGLVRLETRD